MSARWNAEETEWICSIGEWHRASEGECRSQEVWEPRPPKPSEVAAPDPVRAAAPGFFLTLPNFVRVRIDKDTTIGRSPDSVIGLSMLQYGDVSRTHLEIRVDGDSASLRFVPVKPSEAAPVYYYPMPAADSVSVETLTPVVPVLVRKGDERLDELILDAGTAESRLFCLGQHCFIKFDWGAE